MEEKGTNGSNTRMTQPGKAPSDFEVEEWIGDKAYAYWEHLTYLIEQNYPGIFIPEWLFGGKKHGWSLRYKKNKSFCTFVPEKKRFVLLIVFGAPERAKVEAIRDELSARTQREYDKATTYHDGKWVLLTIDSDKVLADVLRLLETKRTPKNPSAYSRPSSQLTALRPIDSTKKQTHRAARSVG